MKKSILLYVFLIFSLCYSYAQKRVHVITKTITKEFKYSSETFIIQGEKSNINIQGWDNKNVKIEIKLISKNPVKSKAEKDLNVLKYSFGKDENRIKVKNYFQSNKMINITSNLITIYSIYIPKNCNINLTNLYGDIIINKVKIKGSIKNSFGNLTLNNSVGNCEIDLHYADLNILNLSGSYNIKTKNSDAILKGISGDYKLKSIYGSMEIGPGKFFNNLAIDAQRTKISVRVSDFEQYNYSLTTQNDKINIPVKYKQAIKKQSGLLKFNKTFASNHKLIKIYTTFCPITIKK